MPPKHTASIGYTIKPEIVVGKTGRGTLTPRPMHKLFSPVVESGQHEPCRTHTETQWQLCLISLSEREWQKTEEDHSIISERLPVLIVAESKREKQEKKETLKKIAQIKAVDPKEMSVALLREVLMEIGASFKSNDKKAKLIEKVIQAKMLQNDTGDDNLLATVSPMDSVSAYIEEPCEVPEGPKFD